MAGVVRVLGERHERVPVAREHAFAVRVAPLEQRAEDAAARLVLAPRAAAEQARRQSALEVAVNNYALANRNAENAPNALRYRIAEGRGVALMLLGRYDEANEQLLGVIDLVEDAEKKACIEALQGEIAFKQGAIDRSVAFFEAVPATS